MLRSLLKFSPPARLVKADCFSTQKILSLSGLQTIDGSRKKRIRVGRGTGSGRGKLCGYGHQKSRSTPPGFEGGQTPFYKTRPKIGFHNYNQRDLQVVTLDKVQTFIDMGRLKPPSNGFLTVRDLLEAGLISSAKEGVKLLCKDNYTLRTPVHFEVSFASAGAIAEVEAAGGTVTCVHFNRLALRSLIKPLKFDILPRRARPNPKIMDYYLDKAKCGYLAPEIQQRNIALFGAVTSEPAMREQFDKVMHQRRIYIRLERDIVEGVYDQKNQPAGEAGEVTQQ